MKKKGLIPNKSYDIFVLGDNISNYLHLPHRIDFYDDDPYICHDTYYFDNFNFEIWVVDSKIDTICCDIECYWKDKNLIKMPYDIFLTMINYQQPDSEDSLYVLTSKHSGQNQKVYDFNNIGLMVWVWRKKIRSILISNYEDE